MFVQLNSRNHKIGAGSAVANNIIQWVNQCVQFNVPLDTQ